MSERDQDKYPEATIWLRGKNTGDHGIGCVYFTLQEGSEYVKVGVCSHDPIKRAKTLNCGNPNRLRVLVVITTYDFYTVEENYHDYLKKIGAHHDREWFVIPPNLLYEFVDVDGLIVDKGRLPKKKHDKDACIPFRESVA